MRRNYRTRRGKYRSKWHTGKGSTERKRRRPCAWYLRWISNIRGGRENEEGNTLVLQGWPKMCWNTCQRYWIFDKNRASSQNIDFPESFILPFLTRKVSTVIFSEGSYALSRWQNDKTSNIWIILFPPLRHHARTRSRMTVATTFSRQNDAGSRLSTT